MRRWQKQFLLVFICLLLNATLALSAWSATTEELAKQSQNPVSSLISVPFENNTNFNIGPEDDIGNVLSMKPVYPVALNENWSLINRLIIPGGYQENSLPGGEDVYGIGDITYQGFFSPAKICPATGT